MGADPDEADRDELQSILDEEGIDASVALVDGSLTASADGGALHALVIFAHLAGPGAWGAVCGKLAEVAGRKGLNRFNEIRKQWSVDLSDREIYADIADVPPRALDDLADPPPAPSGQLVWRVNRESWADAFEVDPDE